MITLDGRIKLQTRIGEYQRERANGLRGQADLIYRNGVFYLIAAVDLPEEPQYQAKEGTLGIDLGIENLATDSDGEIFSGKQVENTRRRYSALRSKVQRLGTRSEEEA
jgi:putative transposase